MKHCELWRPSRFVNTRKGLRASRDPREVIRGSRFITDILAQSYERIIRLHAKGRLLDMGCGKVPLYGVYRDLVEETICIDWSGTLHPSVHLDYETDLSGPLPFDNESFDTILLTDVLEHLPEPRATIAEAARILRRNGELIIGVPFFCWIHEAPHDYHRYTEFAIRRMCHLSGLRIVHCEAYGGLPEAICDLAAKAGMYLPWLPRVMFLHLHAVAASLTHTSFAKLVSQKTKCTFPLGYLAVAQKLT